MATLADISYHIDNLVYQAETLIERRDAEALPLAEQLMAQAMVDGSSRALAQAKYILAYYNCMVANNYEKAIELCESIAANTNESDLYDIDYKMQMTLGNAYHFKGELFSAQHCYMHGLRQMESRTLTDTKEKLFSATFYYNLSIIFTSRKLNNSGEEYLQKAIRLYEEAGSVFKLSKCYSAYADILQERGEFDKAIDLMRKALALDSKGEDHYSFALSQANLGILHSHMLMYNEAVYYLDAALTYFEKQNKLHETALVQFNLGKVVCKAGRAGEGIKLFEKAEQIFKRLENKQELTNVYELLSETLAEKGDYKLALAYHHRYSENVKFVFDTEKANALTRAKQEFETEQKEKEAALLREKNAEIKIYVANLEAANKELEALSYSVSHDLKVPLAMIKNINSMTTDDQSGYHKFIDTTCKQALASIDNILSFSENINKNLLSSEYKVEEIYPVIAAKVAGLKPVAQLNHQAIELLQKDRTFKVRLNSETFGRAIANLLGNSIKFSAGAGKISIEVYAENTQWIIIKLSDQGIGIPHELREHLFQKFSSARREGLKGEKGTGLGLYITHSIIKLHGGTITVDDKPRRGTTFIIKLPLVQNPKSV